MARSPDVPQDYYRHQARHARRCAQEARLVGYTWILTLIYCTSVFAWMGYVPLDQRPDVPPMIWGIPAWVFWGLLVPWVVLIGVTWFFAIFVLRDDEPYMELPADHASRDN